MLLTVTAVGHVMVLGDLAAIAVSAIEGAVLTGGLSAIDAALFSIGIPKDGVIEYEAR
jgi:hypothetical protein